MEVSIDQRMRAHWQKSGAEPRAGAGREEIEACEQRIGRALPPDVASFYRGVNGSDQTDSDLFAAWPLAEIGSVAQVVTPFQGIPNYRDITQFLPEAGDYFAFADCMIWSQVLAVRVSLAGKPTQVAWLSGSSYAIVAPTFVEFWERYLADPPLVLWPEKSAIKSPAG